MIDRRGTSQNQDAARRTTPDQFPDDPYYMTAEEERDVIEAADKATIAELVAALRVCVAHFDAVGNITTMAEIARAALAKVAK